jgi:UDP-3-O-acyl-N-acetylglucosamine deacetylase
MCKALDRKCALSLFGNAVSASHVPFQSDHKVMAHIVKEILKQ